MLFTCLFMYVGFCFVFVYLCYQKWIYSDFLTFQSCNVDFPVYFCTAVVSVNSMHRTPCIQVIWTTCSSQVFKSKSNHKKTFDFIEWVCTNDLTEWLRTNSTLCLECNSKPVRCTVQSPGGSGRYMGRRVVATRILRASISKPPASLCSLVCIRYCWISLCWRRYVWSDSCVLE